MTPDIHAALEPFSAEYDRLAENFEGFEGIFHDDLMYCGGRLTIGDLRRARSTYASLGDGVVVPSEATPEMIGAFWRQKNTGTQEIGGERGDTSDYAAYRAMIDAAPSTVEGSLKLPSNSAPSQDRGVRVKALEWGDDEFPQAEYPFGIYQIAETLEGSFVASRSAYSYHEEVSEPLSAVAEAKAAAQADYERRILAALEAAPAPAAGVEETLRDARDNGLIYWEPNTERGHVQKARMLARIDAVLSGASVDMAVCDDCLGEGWTLTEGPDDKIVECPKCGPTYTTAKSVAAPAGEVIGYVYAECIARLRNGLSPRETIHAGTSWRGAVPLYAHPAPASDDAARVADDPYPKVAGENMRLREQVERLTNELDALADTNMENAKAAASAEARATAAEQRVKVLEEAGNGLADAVWNEVELNGKSQAFRDRFFGLRAALRDGGQA